MNSLWLMSIETSFETWKRSLHLDVQRLEALLRRPAHPRVHQLGWQHH
jgi:hypothetical protein